jgi:hypothetical protein
VIVKTRIAMASALERADSCPASSSRHHGMADQRSGFDDLVLAGYGLATGT